MILLGEGLGRDNVEQLLVICDCGANLAAPRDHPICRCPRCGQQQFFSEMQWTFEGPCMSKTKH